MAKTNSNVATLHADDDVERRDRAVTSATHQMEAIFGMLLVCVQYERGEIPNWPIDPEALPDVIRALAIRGNDLNSAVMSARLDEVTAGDMEALVFLGSHIVR
jgi:hypothetical protein